MNREIKFRAWDWNQWRYGTYYYGVMYPTSFEGHYVDDMQIDENTLGQFTGLTDKNGKEKFEGDITSYPNQNRLFKIEFIDGAFWEVCINDPSFGKSLVTDGLGEIIGNLYENPELLKI